MIYAYKCTNEKCENYDIVVDIIKGTTQADQPEFCEKCHKELKRVYSFATKTNDGLKTS